MPTRNAYDVPLSIEDRETLVTDLINELTEARNARTALDDAATYWMSLYEQQRTRGAQNAPWPDAADLTSYIGTEKVDAIHARTMRTIFTEPVWSVEGWGEAADRAPLVEEFHQWKQEEERLQAHVDRAVLLSWIDPVGVLEVSEQTETRSVRERILVEALLDPATGSVLLDAAGRAQPDPAMRPAADGAPAVEVVVDRRQRIRRGPAYKVIPFRDFWMLPGHARDRGEVYAYVKRFYRRLAEIQASGTRGFYNAAAVKAMTEAGERAGDPLDTRSGITITDRPGQTAEKELFEVLFLRDLDGTGERWYLATIHDTTRQLLRLQYDDLASQRFVLFVPLPRPDSVYGYSLIGDKLITTIEEHTAWRNLLADKAAMSLMAPIKRMQGALWDPDEQALGPKSVIDVRDMREVEPMQFPDLTRGALNRETEVLQASERIAGVNDIALGTQPRTERTLGEVQMTTEQAFVRMDQVTKRIQESMEDLGHIRHEIWKRTLAEAGGEPMAASMLTGLEVRGAFIAPDRTVTAELLDGRFRFKPRGSVETADPNRQRNDFVQFVQMLPALLQAWPLLAQQIQTPQAARAMLEEAIRLFGFHNRQAFIGPAAGRVPGMGQIPAGGQTAGTLSALAGLLGPGVEQAASRPGVSTEGR